MTLASLQIALYESFSVAGEREYSSYEMWVMAELVAKATASFIADINVTTNSIKVSVSVMFFEWLVPTD